MIATASTARADRIALESYAGPRPAEAATVMGHLRKALQAQGYIWDPAVLASEFIDHAATDVVPLNSYTAEGLNKDVEYGFSAWSNGNFEEAQKTFDATLAKLRKSPLLLVRELATQDQYRRALIYAALANKRLSEGEKATSKAAEYAARRDALMSEEICTFPDRPIGKQQQFSGEAVTLYETTRRALERDGLGSLAVRSSEAGLTMYVNGAPLIQGKTLSLIPGTYRVLVVAPGGVVREYAAVVKAKQTTQLVIQWDVDTSLVVQDWVGWSFVTREAQQQEAALTVKLAQGHHDIVQAAIFTITSEGKQVYVTGTLYDVAGAGKVKRRGRIVLNAAELAGGDERLSKLVKFLDGRDDATVKDLSAPSLRAEAVVASMPSKAAPAPVTVARAPSLSSTPRGLTLENKLIIGLGVLSVVDFAVVGTVGAIKGDRAAMLVGYAASGSSLLLTGIYYWAVARSPARVAQSPKYSVLATPDSIGVGYSKAW
ncbi:MAG TPA: hypothetical protein PLF40_01075 [Kofleriaceae bacterium]|nr:hypothetical protein [Kofleriaceae bacterium]